YFSVPLFVANLGPPVAVDAGPAKAPQLERGADRIGFVVGWRAWLPLTLQGGRLLGSTSIAGSIWLPRVQSAAGCLVDPAGHDRPPVAGCSCGFWAFRSIAQLTLWRSTASTMVFGPVALWGRVLELERGYRAAYAYPLALFVPGSFALARGLEELYVVPSAAIGETQTPQSFALAMRVALERLITDGRVPPLPRASLRTVEEVFDPLDK
ncbi:MAG: hypothetical protein ACREJS_14125, partial [Candidatus Rokuibacteriota bacterium]